MSPIESIFGTATASASAPDDGVDTRTASVKGGRRTKTTKATTSPDDASGVPNHLSLFHTIIPIPDRKLDYTKNDKVKKNTKKRDIVSTKSVQKRQKLGDEIEPNVNDDDDDDDVKISMGPSLPSTNKDDDSDKNERTIFVGNIPITYTRKHLRQLFLDCGSIQSTRIRGMAIPETDSDTTNQKSNTSHGKHTKTTVEVSSEKKTVIKLPPSLAGQQQIYKKVSINTNSSNSSGTTMAVDTTKKQSNIGYVVFQDKESVEKALLKNNMIVPVGPVPASSLSGTPDSTSHGTNHWNHTRHIRVDRCVSSNIANQNNNTSDPDQNPTLRDPKRTIFVGNLPYHTDEETLHQHILQHMKLESTEPSTLLQSNDSIIESIRIVRNPTTYLCQGFAYVLFTSIQYVPTALRMLHQTTYMKQTLRIQTCKSKTKNDPTMKKKRKATEDHHSKSITNSPRTPNVGTTDINGTTTSPFKHTTKAVGALKRVLQKQQRLLLQHDKSSKNNTKVKTIRKRGPTTLKHKMTKKPTTTNSKKKKK